MPNVRTTNQKAVVGIRGNTVNVRASSFQTGIRIPSFTIPAGTPIGLLLALTYGVDTNVAPIFYSDFRPTSRIV